jgi:hypothetical protein
MEAPMSFKDLFSASGRKERSIQKNAKKAVSKKIKPEDRRPALWALLEEARGVDAASAELSKNPDSPELRQALEAAKRHTEEAVVALLGRFGFIYDSNIVNDEEEKNLVYEGLVALGNRILPQLRRHLKNAPTLSWGLRILNEICDHETTWQVVSEVMKDYEPGYERDPSKKLQLMTFLGDLKDQRAVEVLIPFLGDQDETVRFVTVESLLKQGDERAREPLLQLMTNEEEESGRIKHRIAEGFAETGWQVKGFRGTVEKILPSEFIVDGKGKIKLKRAREEAEA